MTLPPFVSTPFTTAGEGAGDGIYVNLLRFIPDRPDTRHGEIGLGNTDAAEAAAGRAFPIVTRPPFPWEEYEVYLDELPQGTEPVFMVHTGRTLGRPYAELAMDAFGVGPSHVDQWVFVHPVNFSQHFYVALGPFDQRSILSSLAWCGECPPADVKETLGGWEIRGWGEDSTALNGRLRLQPPLYDDLGRGGRFAFRNGALVRTILTDDLRQVIQAEARDIRSLADVPEWRALAERLDAIGAFVAQAAPNFGSAEPYLLHARVVAPDPGDGLPPFSEFLLFGSEELARESAQRIREREAAKHTEPLLWDFNVSVDGPFVVMRYTVPANPAHARQQREFMYDLFLDAWP